ncbi:putative glycolipid-binding domain-containing protein [Clostridium polynesiense]|uniref:putative glycolipid-binding domain-containing protein n=1 Tax=Clostridium polynesiense TaxID=1325933 RepID=UPI00058F8CAD|nr:putative glycolipid-binding domain-containing protein [Clostridium polynesiense]
MNKDNNVRVDAIWKTLNETGLEHLFLLKDDESITANSVILTMRKDMPVRILYNIYCNLDWKVNKFEVQIFDGKSKSIVLQSDGNGNWTTDAGKSVENLYGCIDIDISATPFTNTIPIRRLSLKSGESREIKVVYIDTYNFSLKPVNQRYTCIESNLNSCKYKYENLNSGFMTEFFVDKDGFVIDYPHLFKRVYNTEIKK